MPRNRITQAEYAKILRAAKSPRRHKYNVAAKEDRTVDGITFASKKEAKRYVELKMLVKAGEISHLELQPKFPLIVENKLICTYIADFVYKDTRSGDIIVEDVKGVKTPTYKLKKKLLVALYGIEINET